jgi:hypothetical protein
MSGMPRGTPPQACDVVGRELGPPPAFGARRAGRAFCQQPRAGACAAAAAAAAAAVVLGGAPAAAPAQAFAVGCLAGGRRLRALRRPPPRPRPRAADGPPGTHTAGRPAGCTATQGTCQAQVAIGRGRGGWGCAARGPWRAGARRGSGRCSGALGPAPARAPWPALESLQLYQRVVVSDATPCAIGNHSGPHTLQCAPEAESRRRVFQDGVWGNGGGWGCGGIGARGARAGGRLAAGAARPRPRAAARRQRAPHRQSQSRLQPSWWCACVRVCVGRRPAGARACVHAFYAPAPRLAGPAGAGRRARAAAR